MLTLKSGDMQNFFKAITVHTSFSSIGGFMTIEPDYIGYGESKNRPHPYLLEKSSANSVIDMIDAAIKFGNENSLPLNGQIFLTGYSEGGYVTMAAQDKIENRRDDLHLMASAPMSGPYDLNLTGMGVLSNDTMLRPDFIGAIVYSYANELDLNLSSIISDQYAVKFPSLYDKTKSADEIRSELTTNTAEFFTPTYRGDFLTNPKNPLREAFVENSVDDFKASTKTTLLYCSGDKTVPPTLSQVAANRIGANAIDLNSSLGHLECALPAYGYTVKWFDKVRRGEK
jgi:pimeloyl-ACP methyl ester carboxylesterase